MMYKGKINLKGQMFGEWTVLDYDENGKWACRCSCGAIKSVSGTSLRRGTSTSCGHNTTKFKDLTGQKFGEWAVLNYEGDQKFKCLCSCGYTKSVESYYLTSGKSKSCGHANPNAHIVYDKTFKDLTGKQFGEWKVLEYAGKSKWKCQCSCGVVRNVHGYSLTSLASTSCGHKQKIGITGKRFGRLVAIRPVGNYQWEFQCDCGNKTIAFAHNVTKENGTRSCGCIKKELKLTKEYIESSIINFINTNEDKPYIDDIMRLIGRHETVARNYLKEYGLEHLVNRTSRSRQEREIIKLLENTNSIISSDRTVLHGDELDIYIPEKKIAIEFNGSFWHSELYKDKYYHQNKTLECAKKGIRLIHIFEYEYNYNVDKINRFLLNSVNINNNKIIAARNTIVKEVTSDEVHDFLEENHIFGSINTNINIALIYNNNIIGVMSIGKPRFNNRTDYEIYRLAFESGINIIGGFEKLFKYFEGHYKFNSIASYIDISKFTGNSYLRVGFKTEPNPITEPNYKWVEPYNNLVLSRYQTQKRRLVNDGFGNSNESEADIMHNNGFYKIYDSGNLRLIYDKSAIY